jgi:hypothetical protein
MACIDRVPKCGFSGGPDPIADPLKQFGALVALLGTIVGVLGGLGALKAIAAALGGAFGGGAAIGLLAVLAVMLLISLYMFDRCNQPDGLPQCIAGCVSNIRECFSSTWEYVFPFAAIPNRVDVTVKSFFWDFVELNNSYVYCTNEPFPRLSEIMHCYYYTPRVCNAGAGALIGAATAGIAGVLAGAAVAAAIGCATVVLCVFALILAAIIAVAAALLGAFAGGNIAQAASDDSPPADGSGHAVATGMFVTLNGNMVQLQEDNKANCLWWTRDTSIHGMITSGAHQPFSYCDIDEQFDMDACARVDGGPIM